MHSPFVEMIRTVVRRGVESGDFQVAVDPVQLYISIAALSFFYLSNSATLSVIFGRDLLKKEARDERLDHMVGLVLAALTGKSAACCGRTRPRPRAGSRPSDRLTLPRPGLAAQPARGSGTNAGKVCGRRKSRWTVFIQRVNFIPEQAENRERDVAEAEGAEGGDEGAERGLGSAVPVPDFHRGRLGSVDPPVPDSGLPDPRARRRRRGADDATGRN